MASNYLAANIILYITGLRAFKESLSKPPCDPRCLDKLDLEMLAKVAEETEALVLIIDTKIEEAGAYHERHTTPTGAEPHKTATIR